jgi:hypothetical protein
VTMSAHERTTLNQDQVALALQNVSHIFGDDVGSGDNNDRNTGALQRCVVKFEKTIRDRRKIPYESQAHSFNSHAKDMLQLAGKHPILLLLGVHVSIPPTALRNSPIKPRRVSPWTYKQFRTKTNEHINSLISVCVSRSHARSLIHVHTHTHTHTHTHNKTGKLTDMMKVTNSIQTFRDHGINEVYMYRNTTHTHTHTRTIFPISIL